MLCYINYQNVVVHWWVTVYEVAALGSEELCKPGELLEEGRVTARRARIQCIVYSHWGHQERR